MLRGDGGLPARAGQAARRRSTRSCAPSRPRPRTLPLHEPLVELARASGPAASSWSSGCWRWSSGGAARPTWASPARCCCWRRTSPSATSATATRALDLHRRAEEMQPRSLEVLSGIARLARQQAGLRRVRSGRGPAQARRRRGAQRRRPPPRRCTWPAALELGRPEDARGRHRQPARGHREEPRRRARARRWSPPRACPRRIW